MSERYTVAKGLFGYGVVDLERELIAPALSVNVAEFMRERFVASGPSTHTTWVSCSDAGIDVSALRRESELKMSMSVEEHQRRLPKVGEVWLTRGGTYTNKLTVKLEPVKDPDELSRGYTLCGTCSDGEFRTWAPGGKFDLKCVTIQTNDLVELVSEALPQVELTTAMTEWPREKVDERPPSRDRVGSRCWYKYRFFESGWKWSNWESGFLRAWSTDTDDGCVCPVAIVENDATLKCSVVLIDKLCFADAKPEDSVS